LIWDFGSANGQKKKHAGSENSLAVSAPSAGRKGNLNLTLFTQNQSGTAITDLSGRGEFLYTGFI
jgi:hypothetical protein